MPRADLRQRLAARAAALQAAARWRQLSTCEREDDGRARWGGHSLTLFCDNDYLGLAAHPALREAAKRCVERHGVGATSAHLVAGHHPEHAALEAEFADWLGQPRALLFGSGYLANLGVIQGLLGPGDLCVQDKLNHACLLDGAKLAGAALRRYPHGDVEAAARQLQTAPEAAALLATDGVFSMDGDLAPLPALAERCVQEGALLYVDDAHGAGVLGPEGRGTAAALGLAPADVPLQLVTLGKAFGAYGGVVAGEAALIEALLQSARPYLFATALPPAIAAAARSALHIVRGDEGDALRARLVANIDRFTRGADQLGLPRLPSATAIQPILLGSDAAAVAAAAALREAGFGVVAIRPPTVPEGQARLRITLNALHAPAAIDALLEALARILPATPRDGE